MNLYLNPRFFKVMLEKITNTLKNLPPLLTGLSVSVLEYHTIFNDQHSQVNADPINVDFLPTVTLPPLLYSFIIPINLAVGTNGLMTDLTLSGEITTINYVFDGVKPGLYDVIFYAGSNAPGFLVINIDDMTSNLDILFNYDTVNQVIGTSLINATTPLTNNYDDSILLPTESKKSIMADTQSVIHVYDEIKTLIVKFRPAPGINFILADKVYLVEINQHEIFLPLPEEVL
jgi:hypothetical protein